MLFRSSLGSRQIKRFNLCLVSMSFSEMHSTPTLSSYLPLLLSSSSLTRLNTPATSVFYFTLTLLTGHSSSLTALSQGVHDGAAQPSRPRIAGAHVGCIPEVSGQLQPHSALLGHRPHRTSGYTHGQRHDLRSQVQQCLGTSLLNGVRSQ